MFKGTWVNSAGARARYILQDLNRVRWATIALRTNDSLAGSIFSSSNCLVVDSTTILFRSTEDEAEYSHVILWDGLSSLLELWQERPLLRSQAEITYLYVGSIADVLAEYPNNSRPLFLNYLDFNAENNAPTYNWVDCISAFRSMARPIQNFRKSFRQNLRLLFESNIVFCGVVRPPPAVLCAHFQHSGMSPEKLQDEIQGFVYGKCHKAFVRKIFENLHAMSPTTPADWSAVYATLNLVHRMCVVSSLKSLTGSIMVNEFGKDVHVDPYDSFLYSHNLYLDFGSTRGPDAIYPRVVDLIRTRKSYLSLRFIEHDGYCEAFLKATSASEFSDLCQSGAEEALSASKFALYG